MPRADTVSFLSDYGLADEFVGVVKSVLRQLAPHAAVVDITHDVPAHDIRAGALTLARAAQYLAPGIVLAVVDPGVGTDRRPVAVEAEENGLVFVGPDNGLLAAAVSMVGGARRAVALTNEEWHLAAPGPTFAGRDVFAPVAARLAAGAELDEAGDAIDPFSLTPGMVPLSRVEDGVLVAEVLWVDRFGNAQLNVDPAELEPYGDRVRIRWGDQSRIARRAAAYGDLKPSEIGLVVDSYGLASICLDRRSAAKELKLHPGSAVSLDDPADS